MSYSETKLISKTKLDQDLTVKVTQNNMSGRIFVEFHSPSARLLVQKGFQDTYDGRREAVEFENRIKSLNDLKSYFGVKLEKEVKSSKGERK